jgi:hypothetical protein
VTTAFITIAAVAFLLLTPPSQANELCHPDQAQLQTQGAVQLGGPTVLGQTFVPSAPGQRICRVKLFIRKNMVGAGNLTLRILRSNFLPLDAAVTIPGGAIPMGDSIQVFEFGCNGAPLAGFPFYALKLESPNSNFGAYSWRGIAGDVYAKPGNGGRAWRNANAGVGPWTNLGGFDYGFQIYMCN